jgi:hypothetical protein
MDQPSPFIFLSHSGADSDAAPELKRRLLAAPEARAAGLKVWFDKDDLRAICRCRGGRPSLRRELGGKTSC